MTSLATLQKLLQSDKPRNFKQRIYAYKKGLKYKKCTFRNEKRNGKRYGEVISLRKKALAINPEVRVSIVSISSAGTRALNRRVRNGLKKYSGVNELGSNEGVVSLRRAGVERKGKKKKRLMAVKMFDRPLQPVEEQFRMLSELKRIPELRPFLPQTFRLIEFPKGGFGFLMTDLTHGGKYIVSKYIERRKIKQPIRNFLEVVRIQVKIINILRNRGYLLLDDAFLYQIDPATNTCKNVWLVDFGNVKKASGE